MQLKAEGRLLSRSLSFEGCRFSLVPLVNSKYQVFSVSSKSRVRTTILYTLSLFLCLSVSLSLCLSVSLSVFLFLAGVAMACHVRTCQVQRR